MCTKFPEFADMTETRETAFPLNNIDSPVRKIKYPQICAFFNSYYILGV